ncbi:MAG: hypothetical protein HY607_06170 [Planctomycetes bacterium]|uniref:hypothetical protein n=1 Tax=Candidatus Wunengus californicus TaxID=3367619 RepID=UPI004026108A|nr:hypothetical protein [Planctomycetota bacterium]
MKFEVVEDFKIKTTSKGIIELSRGQIVELSLGQAEKLGNRIKPLPYITDYGSLIIPHNSPQKYYWWNRGQCIKDTLRELGASDEILKRYKSPYSEN